MQRLDNHELPEDLRPLEPTEPPKPPEGLEDVDALFIAFGGDPKIMNDAGSIASAGLVIAQQISELTNAVNMVSYLLCTNPTNDN